MVPLSRVFLFIVVFNIGFFIYRCFFNVVLLCLRCFACGLVRVFLVYLRLLRARSGELYCIIVTVANVPCLRDLAR